MENIQRKIFKLIKDNHEDGLTQSEIRENFDINRYEVELILNELLIKQKIRQIKKGRFKIYKELKNEFKR